MWSEVVVEGKVGTTTDVGAEIVADKGETLIGETGVSAEGVAETAEVIEAEVGVKLSEVVF